MKAATLLVLFALSGVARAQTDAAAPGEVTLALAIDKMDYCLGYFFPGPAAIREADPDDIVLRLALTVRYENHRTSTVFLPLGHRRLTRVAVEGQNESMVVRDAATRNRDVKSLMALSSPDNNHFWTVPGRVAARVANLSVLKYPGEVEVLSLDTAFVPVRRLSSGLDLRGKTIQIVTSRDFSSIPADVVAKLNEKWKNSGTVWTGTAVSNTLALRIPLEPLVAQNCN